MRTDRLLKKNKAVRSTVSYKKAEKIGIIFSVEDKPKHDTVKELVRKFEQDGKQVEVLEFLPNNKDNYEFKFNFFSEKDLSLLGHITSPDAINFAEVPFDFLYYLDTTPNPLVLNILARSQAKCRVGCAWEDGLPYFEFMIDSLNGLREMIDSMYKYTTQLK
ncbi:DUF6913 domain-containing protein [Chryseolinea soli]|uniref:Uncharacterized protein n=1 Tax=Chryseolinea soli TaxID=2321403 RepID=A0A385SRW9_9BACT|nr:hypothetical protein [Chryseolinea soli]AYB33929.1 hypothetical protein D4L85_26605 [Chryseolinea soli]